MSAYVTRDRLPEDAPAVRELFAAVFKKPLSEDLWRWKYAHPAGHGTLVWRGEELVAHYGGMGHDILYFGRPARAVQITDVMIRHSARRSVRRQSPFYLAGSAFLERYIGYGRPYLLGFGFPSDRAMKIGERLGLYAPVGGMVETIWQTAGAKPPFTTSSRALTATSSTSNTSSRGLTAGPSEPFDKHADTINNLWHQLAADLNNNIVTIKNAPRLRRRYLEHPEKTYDLRLVQNRFTRRPLGLLVLSHEPDHSLLMDLVGPLKHFPALLKCAMAASAQAGKPCLKAWCPQAFAARFQVGGAEQSPLPITNPTSTHTPGPAPEEIRDKWWLMPGDTDFL